MTARAFQVGDQIDFMTGARTVLAVCPYKGMYPQWFNATLVLTSPHTRSGRIELAYDDLGLRGQS